MNELGRVLQPWRQAGTARGRRTAAAGSSASAIVIWFTHVVPRLGALLSDGAAYRYLPRSVAYLPSFSAFAGILADAGFTEVSAPSPERRHRPMCDRDPDLGGAGLMSRLAIGLCYGVSPDRRRHAGASAGACLRGRTGHRA